MSFFEVRGLTKNFGGLMAVSDLNFEVRQGEILGLIGPNGAGKTTVFNLIAGYIPPTRGNIYFKGEDIAGKKPYLVTRKGIARTFQIVKPFKSLPVLENVTLAAFLHARSRAQAESEAKKILESVGLGTKAEVKAGDLNLVDQKRLEIARALATRPSLLLLDEPMGGLNPSELEVAAKLVKDICSSGVTIIWVEHVLRAIMNYSNRVVVINYGRKIAEGTPQEIANNEEVISAYLGRKASNVKG